MEDDPYFGASFQLFGLSRSDSRCLALQYKPYEADVIKREAILAEARKTMSSIPLSEDHLPEVAKTFNDYANIRSYLSRDTEGRVVRIDTFSKIFGPGIRTGWIACNSLFAERLMRLGGASWSLSSLTIQHHVLNITHQKRRLKARTMLDRPFWPATYRPNIGALEGSYVGCGVCIRSFICASWDR